VVLSGSRPVIGLTTYLAQAQTGVWDVLAGFLPAVYFQGVIAAGGVATLLPPQPVDSDIAERALDGLDGLLITGGTDVDPAAYGQQPHPSTDQPGHQRDAWEFALLDAALKRDLKSGRRSIHTLLLNPPEYVETAKVFDMLLAVPKYGRVKVNKILAHCRIAPSKTIGGLSERQRSELVSLLHR